MRNEKGPYEAPQIEEIETDGEAIATAPGQSDA